MCEPGPNIFNVTPVVAISCERVLTIPTTDLVKVYKEKSLVLDKQVTFEQAGKTYTGVAKEIGDKGQLLVLTDDGQEKWLTAGEVSLTSW